MRGRNADGRSGDARDEGDGLYNRRQGCFGGNQPQNSRLGAHRRVQRRVQLRRADADEHQRQRRCHPSRSTTPHCEVPGLCRARSRPTARAPLQWRQSRVVAVSRLEEKQIVALALSDLDRWVDAVFAIDSRVPTARFDRRPRSARGLLYLGPRQLNLVIQALIGASRTSGVSLWREPVPPRARPADAERCRRSSPQRCPSRRVRRRVARGFCSVARARAVAVPRIRRAEVPAIVSDISLPTTARPSTTPASSLDAAQHHPPSDPTLDLGKVALGSAALFCLAVAHPDPAFAREVTLDLPAVATLPDIPSDPRRPPQASSPPTPTPPSPRPSPRTSSFPRRPSFS